MHVALSNGLSALQESWDTVSQAGETACGRAWGSGTLGSLELSLVMIWMDKGYWYLTQNGPFADHMPYVPTFAGCTCPAKVRKGRCALVLEARCEQGFA